MKLRVLKLTAFCTLLAACTGNLIAQESADLPSKELTLERLYASPSLNGPSPTGVKYSPDGTRVTFLKARAEDSSRYDLWQFDVASGAQSMLVDSKLLEPEEVELSEEEKALRERKRIAGRKGIVDYDWGTAETILVPLGGDLHLVTLGEDGPQTRQLTETDAFEYDAKVSPRGNYVSFVREGAVFIIDLSTGEERQITPDAEPENAVSYGVAEFVAQEEMSRYTGYWWSPDERHIAYTRVDESTVDIIPRFDIAADEVTVIEQRYPRAGRPNALVQLHVTNLENGDVNQLASVGPDTYLARVNWAGSSLWFQTVNRDQTEIRYNRTDGLPWRVWSPLKETQENWVNLSNDFVALDDGILLTTEESGYRHIAVSPFGSDSDKLIPVTGGKWVVSRIEAVDRASGSVYFTGFADTPLEKHLYRIPLPWTDEQLQNNDETGRLPDSNCVDLTPMSARADVVCPSPVRITEAGKSWSISMAPDGNSFVGTSSSPSQPPQTGLYRINEQLVEAHTPSALDIMVAPATITEDFPVSEIAAQIRSNFYGMSADIVPSDRAADTIRFEAISADAMEIFQSRLESVTLTRPDGTSVKLRQVAEVRAADIPSYFRMGAGTFQRVAWIEENALDESHPYFPYLADHTVPEFGTLTADDGQTLHYSIQTPPDFNPARKYPVIIEVYGGPHVQTVDRDWESLSDQYLTRQGYIVFRLDNRGSYNRGKRFEDVIFKLTGAPEVRDQLAGVDWLKSQPFVDPDRIAIQGWSYGGYMTLMTILQAPEGTFAAAAAGAPVTDWALYDTFYTERYMRTPENNAEGYEKSSVLWQFETLNHDMPPLLLMHGMADDNVTFDNTTRLMAAMQEAGQMFELMTYPGQRHGIRGQALQTHLMRTRMAFLNRHLKPGQPE